MKKILLGIIIALILMPLSVKGYQMVKEKGDWDEWWKLDRSSAQVKRIYDKENRLVCWIVQGVRGSGGIDCEPSIELEHPSTK